MSRIDQRFAELRQAGRKAVIPYVVAGDPTATITVALMHGLVEAGADIIELGVPFSDPMAEGPVIAKGHERALVNGMSLNAVLELVSRFREDDPNTPLLLMGYANPVEHMGYEKAAEAASRAGVDAFLTVDIPPEEAASFNQYLHRHDMNNILLVAPTTPSERVQKIAELASGFVYYVSLKGVTGSGNLDVSAVATGVAEVREHSALPVAVGFGIKDAASASAVSRVADGVVVGSALVQALFEAQSAGGSQAQVIAAATTLVKEIREAVDAVSN